MERRRALAWAGSITLTACASAIVLGSAVGGFGLGPPPRQGMEADISRLRPGQITPSPLPDGTETGAVGDGTDSPAAENTGTEPAAGGGESKPASGGAGARGAPADAPAVGRSARSPAAGRDLLASVALASSSVPTSVGSTTFPQRDLDEPATPARDTGAGAPKPDQPKPDQQPPCDVAVNDPVRPITSSPGQRALPATVARLGGTPGRPDHRSADSGQRRDAGTVRKADIAKTGKAQLIASVRGEAPGRDTKTSAGEGAATARSGSDG